jgi:uncharacterized protein (DUF1330 family)
MDSTIQINEKPFKELASSDIQTPVVMLNLLKFRRKGGRENYRRYMAQAGPFIEGVGARVIYFGNANELLNGTETWDVVMLVEYPSRQAFLQMATDPDYRKAHKHREAALEKAVLYATDPAGFKDILPT